MHIRLDNVLPVFMKDTEPSKNSLWLNQIVFNPSQKILINAISGKGKTSLTNILCGLLQDYEGNVFFDDINVRNFTIDDWTKNRKNKCSFVFQDLQLFSHLTVRENFELIWMLTNENLEEKAKEYCRLLNIHHKWDTLCAHLSMGQKQRVAIVRSLCRSFELLVLDEPFSHLDSGNSQIAFEIIEQRVDELNAGFVLTTLNDVEFIKYDIQYYL